MSTDKPELESKIEARFVKNAKRHGWKTLKLNTMGNRSWPDRLVCADHNVKAFIEFKRPVIGKLSAGQELLHEELSDLGHEVLVTTSAEEAERYVLELVARAEANGECML